MRHSIWAASGGAGSLIGQVAVVTGGNSGIGYETARALAHAGARVVLACRDLVKGNLAAAAICSELATNTAAAAAANAPSTSSSSTSSATIIIGSNDFNAASGDNNARSLVTTPQVTCMALDLASLESVRRFAADFLGRGIPLHRLVHNGGVMPCPFSLTRDGHETAFQVNFLSPFLLTNLLTPHMRSTSGRRWGGGRVIFVTSAVHRFSYRGGVRLDHLSGESAAIGYDPVASYAQSKLSLVLHTRNLDCRLRASRKPDEAHIHVFAVHPGAIITPGWGRCKLKSINPVV